MGEDSSKGRVDGHLSGIGAVLPSAIDLTIVMHVDVPFLQDADRIIDGHCLGSQKDQHPHSLFWINQDSHSPPRFVVAGDIDGFQFVEQLIPFFR